jgi:hypothetical protein
VRPRIQEKRSPEKSYVRLPRRLSHIVAH